MPLPADRTAAPLSLAALRAHGERPALWAHEQPVTYRSLADRVESTIDQLGPDRRLVLLRTGNDVDSVVAWLGAWLGGHAAILVRAENNPDELVQRFRPDTVCDRGVLVQQHDPSVHLHPDLSLLLPTSGSTGQPKLVRLTSTGLHANAGAIVQALGIEPTDLATLCLPVPYAYGLSVLHSHLTAGAAVWLTEQTVVDPAFEATFDALGVTTLPGVPYTFDLLDSTRFFARPHPSLRKVTQAGGRLAAERVRALADTGTRQGWSLHVMYGQTEATARITVLPPELASTHAGTVGRPLPGLDVRLDPVEGHGDGVGEVVVRGPSVMLGYADTDVDLARGRDVTDLHTGDLGRWTEAGLLQLVGRRGRVAKPFGQRVDLDGLEACLGQVGVRAVAFADDRVLGVVVEACPEAGRVVALAATFAGLPERVVRVAQVPELPRGPSGKVDGEAARRLLLDVPPPPPESGVVAALYREVLGARTVRGTDTFASLGGDSLTYVAIATRLAERIGPLPLRWPELPVDALEARARTAAPTDGRVSTEVGVLLRAAGILLVTASHAGLAGEGGGAHMLLLLSGYHFARFHVTDGTRRDRATRIARSIARWVVPTGAWLALLAATDPRYGVELLFVNHLVSPPDAPAWGFWFVEALLYLQVLAGLSLAAADRLERRAPFPFALTVALIGGIGLSLTGQLSPRALLTPWGTLWVFGLGWSIQRADEPPRKVAVAIALAALTATLFGVGVRGGAFLLGGLLLLIAPSVPLPRALAQAVSRVAAASLPIYLTHETVFAWVGSSAPVAWLTSVVVGTAVHLGIGAVVGRWRAAERGSPDTTQH